MFKKFVCYLSRNSETLLFTPRTRIWARYKCCLQRCNDLKSRRFFSTGYEFLSTDPAIQNYFKDISSHSKSFSANVIKLLENRNTLRNNISSLLELQADRRNDEEFKKLVQQELDDNKKELGATEYQLIEALCTPKSESNDFDGVILEISAGVGGQEAMLFAGNLHDMYVGYIRHNNWMFYTAQLDNSDLGGVRHASLVITSKEAYTHLQNESGVHRVQRVPATEKSGRIHTSTVTVAVLPQPNEFQVSIDDKDLIIETKRATGAGGQHVNKTDSAVRITHIPSGLVVECQTDRSQIKNKEFAMTKLKAKLYQQKLEEQNREIRTLRKSQVGIAARSDKVRTYNFQQDRITDHRLNKNFHNLPIFLKGGQLLETLINELLVTLSKERIDSFINDIKSGQLSINW